MYALQQRLVANRNNTRIPALNGSSSAIGVQSDSDRNTENDLGRYLGLARKSCSRVPPGGIPIHLIVSYGRGAPSLSADCEVAFDCVPHLGVDSKLNSAVVALDTGQLGIDAI